MRKPTKKTTAIMIAAVTVLAGGGAAFAYWTAGGSGTGTGATASGTTPITATQTTVVSAMQPGDTAQTISGKFNNTNTSPVYVSTVAVSIASVTKAGVPASVCSASDYTLTGSPMAVNAEIPVGTAQGAWTGATIKFNNKPAVNQDDCKGATVNLAYTVS